MQKPHKKVSSYFIYFLSYGAFSKTIIIDKSFMIPYK